LDEGEKKAEKKQKESDDKVAASEKKVDEADAAVKSGTVPKESSTGAPASDVKIIEKPTGSSK
jgi:hypothetical protein